MDGQLHLHAGLADARSFRPNLYTSKSATRVTTDPEKRSHLHRHKSHHHHHDEHGTRYSSSRRHAAKEAVQSAIQPTTSFGDLLKQARGSKDTSPSHSRKGSVAPAKEHGNRGGEAEGDPGVTITPRRPLRPEDVAKEGQRVEARERDLRATLQSLSDQSLMTSRRLDDTYYSILEKVSTLRQTIGTLQDVSGLTRELHENFETDTKELVGDVRGQVEAFDNLKAQQEQVDGLETRISAGREKADALTTRLAQARERVGARAKAEAELEAQSSRHLRIFWGILASIAALILALILFHQFKPIHVTSSSNTTLHFASRAAILDAPIPDIAKEAILGPSTSTASAGQETSRPLPLLAEDDSLRMFDDL